MNKEGYIQLPRSITNEEDYYKDRFTRTQAYIDLFFLAAWTERTFRIRGNVVTIQRGQVATSIRSLSNRWQWCKDTVQKFLKELENGGKISTQRSRLINVITLNYYFDDSTQDRTQNSTQNRTPIINNNKGKEIKKDNKLSQKDFSQEIAPDFVAMDYAEIYLEWMNYRKEIGKPYKSDTGRKRFYNELVKLSGGDADKARLIVEQSEAHEWQGIFKLKEDNNGNKNSRPNYRPNPNDNIADAQKAALERMQSVIDSTN